MPPDRFKNERGHPDAKKRADWRFTGDPKEYSKYKDRVAYDLKKLDTNYDKESYSRTILSEAYQS